ncbi:DNA starvation/stationary phase protection protein [Anaplasmataceae bacterium AB001_6]|nr:DNA starvation/stationary phase protection protein [Anaplasmataceae bacterium AB001_6]
MKNVFVHVFALGQKLQFYHWNISGENFFNYHKMLEGYYDEIFKSIDKIAERIVFEEGSIDSNFDYYAKNSSLSYNKYINAQDMLKDLLSSYKKVSIMIINLLSNKENNKLNLVSEDLMISLLSKLDEHTWMISKSLE